MSPEDPGYHNLLKKFKFHYCHGYSMEGGRTRTEDGLWKRWFRPEDCPCSISAPYTNLPRCHHSEEDRGCSHMRHPWNIPLEEAVLEEL